MHKHHPCAGVVVRAPPRPWPAPGGGCKGSAWNSTPLAVCPLPPCCCCLRYTIGFPPSVSRLAAVILPLSLYTLIMYIATLRSAAVSPSPLVGAPLWAGEFWGLGGGLGACTAGGGPGGGLGAPCPRAHLLRTPPTLLPPLAAASAPTDWMLDVMGILGGAGHPDFHAAVARVNADKPTKKRRADVALGAIVGQLACSGQSRSAQYVTGGLIWPL
jgi:hypothetical protein